MIGTRGASEAGPPHTGWLHLLAALLLVAGLAACEGTAAKDFSIQAEQTTNQDFDPETMVSVGNEPLTILTVDFDSDGDTDVAVVNQFETVIGGELPASVTEPGTITLLENNGGTLQVVDEIAVGLIPGALKSGDLNGDGFPDLLLLNDEARTLTILFNDGGGMFPTQLDIDPGGLMGNAVMTDLNGDGSPAQDIVVSLAVADSVVDPGAMIALVNDGSGSFASVTSDLAGGAAAVPTLFIAEDFDGDALVDLAVINRSADTVVILRGDGVGNFSIVSQSGGDFVAVGQFPLDIQAADFDGDGRSDLAVSNRTDVTVSLLLGGAGGAFTQALGSPFALTEDSGAPERLIIGNYSSSGLGMLVVQRVGINLSILDGNGSGGFTLRLVQVSNDPFSGVRGDFNADGQADIVLAESIFRVVSVLAGNGVGNFTRTVVGFDTATTAPTVVDLNADGQDDLLLLQPGFDRLLVLMNCHPAANTPCP